MTETTPAARPFAAIRFAPLSQPSPPGRLRIAVSACLLGARVRYDGAHAARRVVRDWLAARFELVPECPEVGIGLGIPRPKIHLEAVDATDPASAGGGATRLVGATGEDLSGPMAGYVAHAVAWFRTVGVRGVVLKSRSPSCGVGDARVRHPDGRETRDGTGHFAAGVAAAWPEVPCIPDRELEDPRARGDWVERVRAFAADAPPPPILAQPAAYPGLADRGGPYPEAPSGEPAG